MTQRNYGGFCILAMLIFVFPFALDAHADVIIDNGQAGTSYTGSWYVSGAPNPYGANSLWGYTSSPGGSAPTYTWSATLPQSGTYDVYAWWTSYTGTTTRSSAAPYTITYSGGSQTVNVNQRINGGQWNKLGTFNFGTTGKVTLTASDVYPVVESADAVKFVPAIAAPTAYIDSISPNPAVVGQSVQFVGHGTAAEGTVTAYLWESSIAGALSDLASFSTSSLAAGTHTISFRIQDSSGVWSGAANATLQVRTATHKITATAGANGSISPSGEVTVADMADQTFTMQPDTGYKVDDVKVDGSSVGSVSSYNFAQVTADHTIEATFAPVTSGNDVIIDNGDPGTSYTGTWAVSGGTNPYGADSLWARNGATYTWTFSSQPSGTYEVFMWWSWLSSRATNIAVQIISADGTKTVYINQQQNAGQWNSLGRYYFGPSGSVKITAASGSTVSTCADAVKFAPVSGGGGPITENIFIATGYATVNARSLMVSTLQNIGASQQADGSWTYLNSALNKIFVVRFANSNQDFLNALMTEGAHVLYFGHSNFGLGQVFATNSEFSSQTINNILYVDDDRIMATSSPWITPDLHYLRTTQAYPHFWPIFKDGTSAVMPYVFGDPAGDPAYNYYVTYQVPGNPTYYKIIYTNNGADTAIVRFPDSGKSAWYSSTGAKPNPSTQPQYFITNTAAWSPSFLTTGNWTESQGISGYYKENYDYSAAGQGDQQAQWLFSIPRSGDYNVSAWWPSSSTMTSGAPYTVNSASGATTVPMDQRYNGKKWNSLGTFHFDAANYSVVLTDAAPPGNVVADAIKVADPNNPADVTQVNFFADRRYGAAPLKVNFTGNETGDVSRWSWNFGDGGYTNQKDGGDSVEYIYENPGTYTVTLTGYGSLGNSTKSKTGYIYVGSASAPLQAEFRPSNFAARNGPVPLTLTFTDMSTGSIASRLWDFGDGTTSTSKSPSHTYTVPGIYTVKLTVTDTKGNKSTETKQNIIRPVVFEKIVDNVDYPKVHFGKKTVVFRKDLAITKEQMKYARMLYTGCDSAHYYTDTFGRGIMFYAVKSTGEGEVAMSQYLSAYMSGKSDYEIWQIIQAIEPVYDYYDFTKTPSQQP